MLIPSNVFIIEVLVNNSGTLDSVHATIRPLTMVVS
jgi:hypothetical protein